MSAAVLHMGVTMHRRCQTLLVAVLATLLAGTGAAWGQSEEDTLRVLAHQAFLGGHQAVVTLPDLSTERISRSTLALPPGWPPSTPKGLVEESYFTQALLSTTLANLDNGVYFNFHKEGSWDIYFVLYRNSSGNIVFQNPAACANDECLGIRLNNCEDGEGTQTCKCAGSQCDSCSTGSDEFDHDQTGAPEPGDTFTSMSDSSSHEVCSVNEVGGSVVSVEIF